jgi:DNA (cytosine-5)-methyltransferase 1
MSRAYYNEFDPFAAQWLRNLIAAGEIADGDVDERSICDVRPDELRGYGQVHMFAGIGGWSRALRLAGVPDDRPVWTGSCPCQDFSSAGKAQGHGGARNLWPEMLRLIRECVPSTVFGEQVSAAIRFGWLDGIQTDLEENHYACGSAVVGAHSVGAPHIRQRLFWGAKRLADASIESSQRHPGGFPAAQAGIGGARPCDGDNEHGGTVGGLADLQGDRASTNRPEGRSESNVERDSTTLRLAHRDGRNPSTKREQCSGEQRRFEGDGSGNAGVERLVETLQPRPQGHARHGDNRNEPGRIELQQNGSAPATGPWSRFSIIPTKDGKFRRVPAAIELPIQPLVDGFSASLGVPCPERYPLSQKEKGRVGALRGAGNAIVPPLAANFIIAFMDATEEILSFLEATKCSTV